MTLEEIKKEFINGLLSLYPEGEAGKITDLVLEKITGWKQTERIMRKEEELKQSQQESLEEMKTALLQSVPVQYVLKEAWFMGNPYYVDASVLIPRPETEELVEWVLERMQDQKKVKVLDIGTGSGCIAISLKKARPDWDVWAIDLSPAALTVAERNANLLDASAHFLEGNILDDSVLMDFPVMDVLVSNPPYIPVSERGEMEKNVVEYEPETALFVPEEDPLLFYKRIGELSKTKLTGDGTVFVEINESLGSKVKGEFEKYFKTVLLKKDFLGKDRMVLGKNSRRIE